MSDYQVGYGKPPLRTRFKAGVSPNPKGRPKRDDNWASGIVNEFLGAKVLFQEGGKLKKASRAELIVKRLINSALNGNIRDAAQLLKMAKHARLADVGPLIVRVSGGLRSDRERNSLGESDLGEE